MNLTLETMLSLLTQYGYLFLFGFSIFEGPIITILGGFLASQGIFHISLTFLILVVGDLTGDLLYYVVGRFGIMHTGLLKLLRIQPESVRSASQKFRNHVGKTLFLGKYTQTGIIVLPAAGVAGIPLLEFLAYNLLATIPKTAGLMILGYFFGYAYQTIDTQIRLISVILCGIGIMGIVVFFYVTRER